MEGAVGSFGNIDWSATKAYCSEILAAPPSVWINTKGDKPFGIVSEEEYEPLLREISEKIGGLKDPRTGEPIVSRVYRRDELFHGPFAQEAPDLMLDWWSEKAFSTKTSFPEDSDKPVIEILPRGPVKGPEWGGTHRKDGVLIARGKSVKAGTQVEGARLRDLAPTLLYLLGQKVPDDMDGRVLTEIINPEFVQRQSAQYTTTAAASEDSEGKSYSRRGSSSNRSSA